MRLPLSDIGLVWRNMTRKKLRLCLMLLAMAVAFLLYGFIGALTISFDRADDVTAANRLVVVNKVNFTSSLPYAYYNRIQSVPGVVAVTHWNWFGGYFQENKNSFPMFAADIGSLFKVYPEISVSAAEKEAVLGNRQALLVGKQTAEQFGWEVGDRIAIRSNIFYRGDGRDAWEFDIAAIYVGDTPQFQTRNVYFHYPYFNEGLAERFGRDQLGLMALLTQGAELNDGIVSQIDAQFANSFAETETITEQAFIKQFIEQAGDVTLIITSVVGAAFFVILIVVGNSMALAVRERVGEIAVLKTLGFSSVRIAFQILAESTLLALVGGGLGLLASFAAVNVASSLLPPDFPRPIMNDAVFAQGFLYMIALGLVTGLIPAVHALRINLLLAFRKL